jgi:hypothetical protein
MMSISPRGIVLGSAALCAAGAIVAFMIPDGEPGEETAERPVPAAGQAGGAVITPLSGSSQSAIGAATMRTAFEESATPAILERTPASSMVAGSKASGESAASISTTPSSHLPIQEELQIPGRTQPQLPIESLRSGSRFASQNGWAAGNSASAAKNPGKAPQTVSREVAAENFAAKAKRPTEKPSVAGETTDAPRSNPSPSSAPRAEEPFSAQARAPRTQRQWPRGNFTVEEERERAQYGWQAFADRVFDDSVGANPP